MFCTSSSIPYRGILAILCIMMRLGLADATIGYDCYSKRANLTIIQFENLDAKTRETWNSNKEFYSTHPDQFAYQYMGGPGYMSLMENNKLYILHCVPVDVTLLRQDKCYDRLAILKGDQRQFLIPHTHIITRTATELPCDSPLLQDYVLDSTVHKVQPRSKRSSENGWTWQYQEIPNLFSSGIYTEQQMENRQKPEIFNPPPALHQVNPDANGNTPGVIDPPRDESIHPKVEPRSEGSSPIVTLKPETYGTWQYQEIPNLFSSGIYREKEVENWQLRRRISEIFHPPPALHQVYPDANGNTPGVIYPPRDESIRWYNWYKTWNTYSVIALVSVSIVSILVIICIVRIISNRQRRRRMESDHYSKINVNKFQNV